MIEPARSLSEKEISSYMKSYVRKVRFKRTFEICLKGWKNAGRFAKWNPKALFVIWRDMIKLCRKYLIDRKGYVLNRLCELKEEERENIGRIYYQHHTSENRAIEWNWNKEYFKDRAFQNKYTSKKWEKTASKVERRRIAYKRRYNMGDGCIVQYDVDINRAHLLNGKITIGNHVLLAKHVFIDYSGDVIIKDDVKLSAGVTIESHSHEFKPGPSRQENMAIPTRIEIENGVWVGTGATICESCGSIGRFAQIGAGTVLRKSIPPYSLVVGNPAKIVGFVFTPEEVREFEAKYYPDLKPTDIKKYELDYQKYFIDRIKDIKQYTKL